jgi:hypothetical protein
MSEFWQAVAASALGMSPFLIGAYLLGHKKGRDHA